jgi:hypothetical protein
MQKSHRQGWLCIFATVDLAERESRPHKIQFATKSINSSLSNDFYTFLYTKPRSLNFAGFFVDHPTLQRSDRRRRISASSVFSNCREHLKVKPLLVALLLVVGAVLFGCASSAEQDASSGSHISVYGVTDIGYAHFHTSGN